MSNGPSKFVPALWGGIVIVVISTVPVVNAINFMCCSGIMLGGLLAVRLYKRNGGGINSGVGVQLGLYAGLIATVISAIVILIGLPFLPDLLKLFEGLIDQPDIDNILDQVGPDTLTHGFLLITIGVSLIINVLFATIGGLVGASFWSNSATSPSDSKTDEDDSIIVEKIDF